MQRVIRISHYLKWKSEIFYVISINQSFSVVGLYENKNFTKIIGIASGIKTSVLSTQIKRKRMLFLYAFSLFIEKEESQKSDIVKRTGEIANIDMLEIDSKTCNYVISLWNRKYLKLKI